MMKRHFLLLALAWCALLPAMGHAADSWQAGVASVIITPDKPVPMAGYATRTRPFERVEHDIYAKAIALRDSEGNRAVLITTDLTGIPRSVADPVCESITKKLKLKREQILISSSHTHSAPLLTLDEATRYPGISEIDGRNLVAYTRSLQDKLLHVAVEAMEILAPAQLAWGMGVAPFAMNRRQPTAHGVVIGVNARGLVDRSVPVLKVMDAEGKVLAALFSYACHNTTLTGSNFSLCGDYAGFAQLHIEQEHPRTVALFMSGCGGDANPYPRGTMKDAQEHGSVLGQEVCRLLEQKLTPITGDLRCAFAEVELPLQSFTREELETMAASGAGYQRSNASQLLALLNEGKTLPAHYTAPVSVWQVGSQLTLVALPGEVVVDYVPLLAERLGPLQLWVAAYCHDVCGYVPSKRVLREGGYECRGLYTAPGFFAPETQDVLVEAVARLDKVGNQ